MTVEHVDLTDPELHEPKDISTASAGEVYVADGAGSGLWKQSVPSGWGRYHDSAGPHSLSTAWTKITIDGLSGLTDETHLPVEIRGTASLWDTVNNKVLPINEGDAYLITLDFNLSTISTAAEIVFAFDNSGGGSPSSQAGLKTMYPSYRATPQIHSLSHSIGINTLSKNNGIQIFAQCDAGTPAIDEMRITIHRLSDGTL